MPDSPEIVKLGLTLNTRASKEFCTNVSAFLNLMLYRRRDREESGGCPIGLLTCLLAVTLVAMGIASFIVVAPKFLAKVKSDNSTERSSDPFSTQNYSTTITMREIVANHTITLEKGERSTFPDFTSTKQSSVTSEP